jgi:hypothetical protein
VSVTDALAYSVALLTLAEGEPALLAGLAAPGPGPGWDTARAAAAAVLDAAGLDDGAVSVALVLRHVTSQLLWPSTGDDSRVGAALLEKGLRTLRPALPPAPVPAETAAAPVSAGTGPVGWPGLAQ